MDSASMDSLGVLGSFGDCEEARYEVVMSHVKARGSVLSQRRCSFVVCFEWDGEEQNLEGTSGGPSGGEYNWPGLARFMHCDSERKRKETSSGLLCVKLIAVRHHHFRAAEKWLVGDARVSLDEVLRGPVHHTLALKATKKCGPGNGAFGSEVARISYNCRVTQFATWKLQLSELEFDFDPAAGNAAGDTDEAGTDEKAKVESKTEDPSLKLVIDMEENSGVGLAQVPLITEPLVVSGEQGEIKVDPTADPTRRMVLQYQLHDLDKPQPRKFESKAWPCPHVNAQRGTLHASWHAKDLLPVESEEPTRFRSFLSGNLSFHMYEIRCDRGAPKTPTVDNLEASSPGGRTRSTDVIKCLSDEGRLLGETWIPIEQLFEIVQTSQDKAAELCKCNADTGMKKHPGSVAFNKIVRRYGNQVGRVRGVICFGQVPGAVQLGYGVLTEEGFSLTTPLVMGGSVGAKPTLLQRMLRGSGEEADSAAKKALFNAIERLKRALKAVPSPTQRGRTTDATSIHLECRKACHILVRALGATEKESMTAFVYSSLAKLTHMQATLIGLWEVLLDMLDTILFTIRISFFEVITAILMRGELGEFMIRGILEGESTETFDAESDVAKVALNYRNMLCKTLGWVLNKLVIKGGFTELRVFCARIMAIMAYRLPAFGQRMYSAILPEDETSIKSWMDSPALQAVLNPATRKFENPEWDENLFSLNTTSYPDEGSTSQSVEGNSGKENANDGIRRKSTFTSTNPPKLHGATNEQILDWAPFHDSLEKLFPATILRRQDELVPLGTEIGGTFQPPSWQYRIEKHGHFYFLFSREWLIYVMTTIGPLATASTENFEGRQFRSGISWSNIPGYREILKSFLLELRRRDLRQLPESMRVLALTLLVEDALISPFINIVVPKTNLFQLDSVSTLVDLISAWMTTLHGWPGRFLAARLFRKHGCVTAEEAERILVGGQSLFFKEMEKKKAEREKEARSHLEVANSDFIQKTISGSESEAAFQPPPSTLAQLRASGSLETNALAFVDSEQPGGVDGGEAESLPEPFVTAWDFDLVSIYFPHLDVVRRKYKKSMRAPSANEPLLGISKNNDRSKSNWFSHLYADSPPVLPASFDYDTLVHALWELLNADHFQVVLKAIELLYNHWNAFPEIFQDRLRFMFISTGPAKQFRLHRKASMVGRLDSPQSPQTLLKKKAPLLVKLFYHWQEEVRYFFGTYLAFRLCRGNKTMLHEKLLAAVRLLLLSSEPEAVGVLWKGPHLRRQLRVEPETHKEIQKNYLIDKALIRAFPQTALGLDQPPLPSTAPEKEALGAPAASASTSSPPASKTAPRLAAKFRRRSVSFEKQDLEPEPEVDQEAPAVIQPVHVVSNYVEHLKRTVSAEDSYIRIEETKDAQDNVTLQGQDVAKASPIVESLKKDLAVLGHESWPLSLRPYSISSVTKFRKLWQDSLDCANPVPHLEWSMMVMDRGEMRAVGGLTYFQAPAVGVAPVNGSGEW